MDETTLVPRREVGRAARASMLILCSAFIGLACGCKKDTGVPTPSSVSSADASQTSRPREEPSGASQSNAVDSEGLSAEEPAAADDAPKRKGVRVVGGLPPIRRADLSTGLTVPGAQRFFLGGGQSSSFYCDVENQGETEVLISSTRGVGATVVARLLPGDSASHRFQPNQAAILANLDPTQPAKLRVRVWGDTNLEMRYEPDQP